MRAVSELRFVTQTFTKAMLEFLVGTNFYKLCVFIFRHNVEILLLVGSQNLILKSQVQCNVCNVILKLFITFDFNS